MIGVAVHVRENLVIDLPRDVCRKLLAADSGKELSDSAHRFRDVSN